MEVIKSLEDMSFEEMEAEIKAFESKKFDSEENYVFISYSHKDKVFVARTVLNWIRKGYNVYIDYDFENHGSDDNWVDIMYDKLASSNCVMVVCFLSEDYYYSYAALIELLTMRSRTMIEYRDSAENALVPIDILLVEKRDEVGKPPVKIVKSKAEFSSNEVKQRYKEEFKKLQENMGKGFMKSKTHERQRMISGFSSLYDEEAEINKNMQYLEKAYSSCSSDFYKKIANYMIAWFDKWNLNGNQKSSLEGVVNRFENLEVYCNKAAESKEEEKAAAVENQDAEQEKAAAVENQDAEQEIAAAVENQDTEQEMGSEVSLAEPAEQTNEEKIGIYVQKCMAYLIEEDKLTEDLVVNMQDVTWSKEVLHLNYAMLLKLDPNIDIKEQVTDDKGRSRYWVKPYVIRGEQYCVCNDWYEKHRKYFEEFLAQVKSGAAFEVSSGKKKVSSLTGDVTYTLYGKEYCENQSDMMFRVFAQVLNRHQDKVDTLPEQDGMNCAEKYENIEQPGTSAAKPCYFRVCTNFEFENGSAVCIGTAYSSGDKMKKIAKLLEICGEDRSVFYSEQLELPEVGRSRASSNGVEYTIYGQKYTGDQTEMMCNVCSTVIAKHPEKLQELVENTSCIGYNDSSIIGKTYFASGRVYQSGGREYKVGTSFSMADKLKQIAKVFAICGEDSAALQIEGYDFEVKEVENKKVMAGKVKKNFFE